MRWSNRGEYERIEAAFGVQCIEFPVGFARRNQIHDVMKDFVSDGVLRVDFLQNIELVHCDSVNHILLLYVDEILFNFMEASFFDSLSLALYYGSKKSEKSRPVFRWYRNVLNPIFSCKLSAFSFSNFYQICWSITKRSHEIDQFIRKHFIMVVFLDERFNVDKLLAIAAIESQHNILASLNLSLHLWIE